jgi:hypothetical protein
MFYEVFVSFLEEDAGSSLPISVQGPDILAASVYLSLYGANFGIVSQIRS